MTGGRKWLNSSGRGRWVVWILAALLLVSAGCATYNAATGRNEFIIIPTDEEVAMGRDIHQQILAENRLSKQPDLVARVNRIGQKLVQVSDRQDYEYHFYVIDKDELNAFTVPGGNVYIYSGLAKKLKSDDEIAGVLGHEIGHCAARHTVKKFQAAVGYNLIGGLLLSQVDEQARRMAALSSNAVMQLVFSAYSRHDEYEADRLSIKYTSLAGYDPNGMIKALEVLKVESKGPEPPLILRTHPYIDDRIEVLKEEVQKLQ